MLHSKKAHRGFYVASLDVKKAFDTVSHFTLFSTLEGRGVPDMYIGIIKELYSGATTSFTLNGESDALSVPVRQGIKQGDPLSPFIFNCVLDPLLVCLNDSRLGYHIDGVSAGAMAFADDLLLFSENHSALQEMLQRVERYLADVGLRLNPIKTQYFG